MRRVLKADALASTGMDGVLSNWSGKIASILWCTNVTFSGARRLLMLRLLHLFLFDAMRTRL